jgi:N-acetylneuraminate lyase
LSTHPFAGMYAAMLTPLTQNGRLNVPVAQKLLLHLMSLGLDGTYIAGTTGEGMRLSIDTRKALLEALMEVLPEGKRVFVHVGMHEVRDAIQLAEHAAAHNAHAVSSLPPAGDSRTVLEYYKELASNSPLPLIVYYFPKAAPHAFQTSQELLNICDLPNVLGVKFTDFNMYLLNQLVKRGKLVFNGYDEALAAGLLMGAQGGIGTTYNLIGHLVVEIFRAAQRGEWETARELQFAANSVLEVLFHYPFFPAVRETMRHLGFDCGPMASGETLASEEDRQRLIDEMSTTIPRNILEMNGWPSSAAVVA